MLLSESSLYYRSELFLFLMTALNKIITLKMTILMEKPHSGYFNFHTSDYKITHLEKSNSYH